MCGLVGVVGNITYKEELAYKMLLKLDTVRGSDSTGSMSMSSLSNLSIAKCVGTPWELFQDYSWKSHTSGLMRILIGHNRAATSGSVTRKTAHPFEFGSIVGVHNGTLTDQSLLEDSSMFSVDSENIFYHMDKNGLDHTLQRLEGAFALVWYDKPNRSVNFIRNSERPLFYTNTGDCIFWASEPWMLQVALSSSNITFDEIISMDEHKHYSVVVDHSAKYGSEVLGKPIVVDKVKFKRPDKVYNMYGINSYGYGGQGKVNSKFTEKVGTIEIVSVVGFNTDPINPYITMECEDGVNVRCFCWNSKGLWETLTKSVGCKAEVRLRRFTSIPSGSYLIADPRHVKLVTEDDVSFDEEELLPVEGGALVPKSTWDIHVLDGCSWCHDEAKVSEAENITWKGEYEFLCHECSKLNN